MNYISPQEIKDLNKNGRLIVFRKSFVYDITDLLKYHPGGSSSLMKRKLTDCEKDYSFHSKDGKKSWKKYLIGSNKQRERCFLEKILSKFFG